MSNNYSADSEGSTAVLESDSAIDPIDVGEVDDDERPDWIGSTAFILVHLSCLAVFFVGFSWVALGG